MKQSRTYKLRLSGDGIDLFLKCHCRLAHLLGDFIPYGFTLSVAVAVLEKQAPEDVIAELETLRCKRALGSQVRFVGSSPDLAEATRRIADRLLASDHIASAPRAGFIYAAALGTLISTADDEIVSVARRTECIETANT